MRSTCEKDVCSTNGFSEHLICCSHLLGKLFLAFQRNSLNLQAFRLETLTGNIARVLIKPSVDADLPETNISFTGICRKSGFRENNIIVPIGIPIDLYGSLTPIP